MRRERSGTCDRASYDRARLGGRPLVIAVAALVVPHLPALARRLGFRAED
jgi:hypothetical protein